jgi:hypothetical protein
VTLSNYAAWEHFLLSFSFLTDVLSLASSFFPVLFCVVCISEPVFVPFFLIFNL